MKKNIIRIFLVVVVIIVLAFYFSSECSVRYGNIVIGSPLDLGTEPRCTCAGIEYQKRTNPEIVGKSTTSMCAGLVLNRYEE